MSTHYSCEVWQPEDHQNLISTDQSTNNASMSPDPKFLIDVFATYVVVDDDDRTSSTSHSRYFQFMSHRQVFIDNATSWSTISNILSQMLVPFHAQPSMIQKISTCAREIASLPGNVDSKTIPLVVSLVVRREDEEETEEREVSDRGATVARALMAAEVLERVSIGGYNCVICLEEILLGCEASKLPCLHFYHENCILSWLEKSNLCPLCRFQLFSLD